MKVAFYAPDGAGDKQLVAAVMAGAARHGDEVKYIQTDRYDGVIADADAVACYGVRASTRIITDAYRRAGKRSLYYDKGYWGRGVYTRVAIDAWQPTAYFGCGRPVDRLTLSGLQLQEVRHHPESADVIFAATTQTWCDFHDVGPARALDEVIVTLLNGLYPGCVVYRPRPAYANKHPELCGPITGARLSAPDVPLAAALKQCRLLVTLGSNAAVEALAAGVKTLVLVDGHPASVLNNCGDWAVWRNAFFADLAYTQWTLDEYLSGTAWADIKETMTRTQPQRRS